jgi:hypothetical protein
MKRIEVKLSLPVVAPLLDVIKHTVDTPGPDSVGPQPLADLDAEFRAAWRDDLLQGQHADVHTLLALFDKEFFANGVVTLDEENAEAIVRACSAVRLRLRAEALAELSDEALESGEVEHTELPEPVRRAFMCYVFLATLQNLILGHLDTAILGEG